MAMKRFVVNIAMIRYIMEYRKRIPPHHHYHRYQHHQTKHYHTALQRVHGRDIKLSPRVL